MLKKRLVALFAALIVGAGLAVVSAPASQAATAPCRQNVYGYGGTGKCVKAIQALVSISSTKNAARTDIGTPIARDGVYGSKTVAAVKKYQKIGGLAVDGRVGKQTWNRLCHYGAVWYKKPQLKKDYLWAKKYAC